MEREMMAGMLEAEKDEAKDRHLDKLKAWEKANGDNIRSLLGNLGQVLWEGCSFAFSQALSLSRWRSLASSFSASSIPAIISRSICSASFDWIRSCCRLSLA